MDCGGCRLAGTLGISAASEDNAGADDDDAHATLTLTLPRRLFAFRTHNMPLIPVFILVVLALTAVFAELIAPYNPEIGVINGFFRGNSTLYDPVVLRGWAVPVLAWSAFIFAIFWTLSASLIKKASSRTCLPRWMMPNCARQSMPC